MTTTPATSKTPIEVLLDELQTLRTNLDQVLWEFAQGIAAAFPKEVELIEPKVYSTWKAILREGEQSEDGQGPKEDKATQEQLVEPTQPVIPTMVLRQGMLKFRTERGWYIKAVDDEGKEHEENTKWLCSAFVNWVQGLPVSISKRTGKNDRAYPSRKKTGIYVNNEEMQHIDMLARIQQIPLQEKEFDRDGRTDK